MNSGYDTTTVLSPQPSTSHHLTWEEADRPVRACRALYIHNGINGLQYTSRRSRKEVENSPWSRSEFTSSDSIVFLFIWNIKTQYYASILTMILFYEAKQLRKNLLAKFVNNQSDRHNIHNSPAVNLGQIFLGFWCINFLLFPMMLNTIRVIFIKDYFI